MRHPDRLGVVAVLSAPLNSATRPAPATVADFDPATFRWKTDYDPDEVLGVFYFGLRRVPARKHIAPVFGDDPSTVVGRIAAVNPADLLFSESIGPGRPAMFVGYGGRTTELRRAVRVVPLAREAAWLPGST